MAKVLPTIVANMVYLPLNVVDRNMVRKNYEQSYYDEKMCSSCPYLEDRHSVYCDSCDGFKEKVTLYKRVKIKGKSYVGLPVGDKRNLIENTGCAARHLKDKNLIVDLRPRHTLSRPISFTGKLHDYQKGPVKRLIRKAYGILRAPPRTGKTVMATYVVCKLRTRSLILTDKIDLLKQFQSTFDNFTDHKDVSFMVKRPLVGIAKTVEDFLRFDVALATYQTFLSVYGKAKLRKIRKRFGCIIVDEVHKGAATQFRKVINTFNARYKFGLSATPKRKDGRHVSIFKLIGPVTAKSERKALKPLVHIVPLKSAPPKNSCKTWNGGMSWIAKDKSRNKAIVKKACELLLKKRSLLITVVRRSHCTDLVNAINKEMGKTVAAEFTGHTFNREDLLAKAEAYKVRCVVGIRSIIATGINVKRWDTLLEIVPLSNEPNHYQEVMRIGTEMEGKPTPEIYHFVSGWGAEAGCLRTCLRVYEEHCEVDKSSRRVIGELLSRSGKRSDSSEEYLAAAQDEQFKPHRRKLF